MCVCGFALKGLQTQIAASMFCVEAIQIVITMKNCRKQVILEGWLKWYCKRHMIMR